MLLVAESETGYLGVRLAKKPGLSKPYEARVSRSGKRVSLGSFATAEERRSASRVRRRGRRRRWSGLQQRHR